jgi:hypothetical protein
MVWELLKCKDPLFHRTPFNLVLSNASFGIRVKSHVWWHMSAIPALGRLRQEHLSSRLVRPCLKERKKGRKKERERETKELE